MLTAACRLQHWDCARVEREGPTLIVALRAGLPSLGPKQRRRLPESLLRRLVDMDRERAAS